MLSAAAKRMLELFRRKPAAVRRVRKNRLAPVAAPGPEEVPKFFQTKFGRFKSMIRKRF